MYLEIGGLCGGRDRRICAIPQLVGADEAFGRAGVPRDLKERRGSDMTFGGLALISATSASLVVRLAIGILAGSKPARR